MAIKKIEEARGRLEEVGKLYQTENKKEFVIRLLADMCHNPMLSIDMLMQEALELAGKDIYSCPEELEGHPVISDWNSQRSFKLVGEYLVIDPCYIIGQGVSEELENIIWSNVCNHVCHNGHGIYPFKMNGVDAVCFDTAHGDGVYPVLCDEIKVGLCGVDAGMLSLLPMEVVKKMNVKDQIDLGYTIWADGYPRYKDGDLQIYGKSEHGNHCHYTIVTSDEDSDED